MAVTLEIAVQDVAGARVARAAGADRLELCQALGLGGLTPSIGLVDRVVAAVGGARVNVLVRPRGGGFVYDADEIALVTADIHAVRRAGAGGVVIGALTPDGGIDREAVRRWRDAAGDGTLVFHRAIDAAADPVAVLGELAEVGVDRVLTSGGAARSVDGVGVLRRLVDAASGIEIMAGGGIRVEDIPTIVSAGVDAVHLSARRFGGLDAPSGPGGGASGYDTTDAVVVAAAAAAVRSTLAE